METPARVLILMGTIVGGFNGVFCVKFGFVSLGLRGVIWFIRGQ